MTEQVIVYFTKTTPDFTQQQIERLGWRRRSVMVQLPEPLPKPDLHLDTITDIGKTRIRRVIGERVADEPDQTSTSCRWTNRPRSFAWTQRRTIRRRSTWRCSVC